MSEIVSKGKQNPMYKGCKVTIFTEGENRVENYKLLDIHGDLLEFDGGLLPVNEATMYFDVTSGGTQYFYHLSLPERKDSLDLKQLRRSVVLQNMFSYDKQKPLDIFKLLPYIVAALAVIF